MGDHSERFPELRDFQEVYLRELRRRQETFQRLSQRQWERFLYGPEPQHPPWGLGLFQDTKENPNEH